MNYLLKIGFVLVFFLTVVSSSVNAQKAKEHLLWEKGIPNNPIQYEQEKVREEQVNESSLSQKNRVFSQVSEPTYTLYKAKKDIANGVAIVICPGGGFRDVWFDREGADFALWLAERGITSLVLKYRTFNADAEGFTLEREVYNPEVYADAKQAIHILRTQSEKLNIDKNKIGISGFSAGGALALYAGLAIFESQLPEYADFDERTEPDFVAPIYPGINNAIYHTVKHKQKVPPMFLVNGAQDDVTPPDKCIQLYTALLERKVPAELHIYAKGSHGFDSGIGRGKSVATWQNSLINWLKDMDFIED
ncbi:alpha/beta hydrolase [uncultured Draconibacterium sp.]|uniref:alpha/beta hydrolase n=1 Tax=uncultured Draconibacterium sp. TaxID=1573823 RepID=UPI0032180D88